jgi:hypothetical protein
MSAPVSCAWGGCGRTARWQIVIKIWALMTAPARRNDRNCCRLQFGVTVCDECKPNVKAADFLLPEGRARIATGLERAGVAMPDFNSAQVDFDEIVDKPLDIGAFVADVKRRGGTIIES